MIGRTLSHYRIVAARGAGGMGEVYQATDERLGRDVALKVLPAETAADPLRLERFRREARAIAALNHPNVVTIYAVERADGVHFLTMELVEGRSLDRHIPRVGLPPDELYGIGSALADALAAAHARGIVHRDLKPANVMIGDGGRVKVLDFGLAKIATSGEAPDAATRTNELTTEGTVLGTMPDMSPEQIQGREVDSRSDIFSLGVVLYEMATGRRPFRADSAAGLASSILRDAPEPVTSIRADLPGAFDRLIEHCLAKEPPRRCGTATEVRRALDAMRQPAGTGSAPSATGERPIADAALSIAVLPFADMSSAKDQDYFCEGMAEEIMSALAGVDGLRVASRTSTFRAGHNGLEPAAIARALGVSHVLEGGVRTAGARLRVTARLIDAGTGYPTWSERYDRQTDDLFAVQDEIAAGVVDAVRSRFDLGSRPERARGQVGNMEAYRHYLMGRHLRYTKNDHGNALRSYERVLELDPSHARSWVGLAEVKVLAAVDAMMPARAAYADAKRALSTAESGQGETADARTVEAMIAFGERDWSLAESGLIRALELQPGHTQAGAWLGMIHAVLGRFGETRGALDRARAGDPLATHPYAMSRCCMLLEQDPAEAMGFCEQALAFDAENSLALWCGGLAAVALGRAVEGVALLRRASTPSHHGGFIHGALGWALARAGLGDEASAVLDMLRSRPPGAPIVVSAAWTRDALGDRDAAWSMLEQARDEYQPVVAQLGLLPFDEMRTDPRWPAFVATLGLPPDSGRSPSSAR